MRAQALVTCLVAGSLLLACGDGGAASRGSRQVGEERPPTNPQDPPSDAQRPPGSAEQAPANTQQAPRNAQDPLPPDTAAPATSVGVTPGHGHGDGGDNGQ